MFAVAHRTPLSAAGCAELADAGASVFELDVQLGERGLVVSHFLPLLGRPGWIENDNWRLRLARSGRHDRTVDEAADLVPAACTVLLDPKETSESRRAALVAALTSGTLDSRRFVVSTPHPDDLAALRSAGLRTWRTIKSRRALAHALDDGPLADAAVSVRHSLLTEATISRLHAIVPCIVAWTVNDQVRARTLMHGGVDGLTSDNPHVLRLVSA